MTPRPQPDPNPNRPTVLVVDDSDVCLELAREALESGGYRVVTTSSPLGVNRLIKQEQPVVIVLDVTMPALRGDKLAELVRRHRTTAAPILLHSDRPAEELASLVKRSGATAYVEKTADNMPLVRAVRVHAARAAKR